MNRGQSSSLTLQVHASKILEQLLFVTIEIKFIMDRSGIINTDKSITVHRRKQSVNRHIHAIGKITQRIKGRNQRPIILRVLAFFKHGYISFA